MNKAKIKSGKVFNVEERFCAFLQKVHTKIRERSANFFLFFLFKATNTNSIVPYSTWLLNRQYEY